MFFFNYYFDKFFLYFVFKTVDRRTTQEKCLIYICFTIRANSSLKIYHSVLLTGNFIYIGRLEVVSKCRGVFFKGEFFPLKT